MSKVLRLAAPVAAVLFAAPVAALAQNGVTTGDVNMRAGPSTDYPRVATIPEDSPVRIHGCLNGYNWCDVNWRGNRGWVSGAYLNYSYNDRYVVVEDWGPRIGIPIISFGVQDYWSRYYRDRPWWSERNVWFRSDWDRRGDRWRDRDGRGDWRDRDGRRDRDNWRDRDNRRDWSGDRDERRSRDRDGGWDRNMMRGDRDMGGRGMMRGDRDMMGGDRNMMGGRGGRGDGDSRGGRGGRDRDRD